MEDGALRARILIVVFAVSILAGLVPPVARAEFGFVPGSAKFEALGPTNQPYRLAGGHPDRVVVSFDFNTAGGKADGNVKELSINLPPGFAGSAGAVPTCPRSVFDGVIEGGECPPDSQVGVATLRLPEEGPVNLPIFEIEAPPNGVIGLGATLILKFPMQIRLRPQDDGVTITMSDLSQSVPLVGAELELWGVPADHQSGTGVARRPLLTLPTSCDAQGLSISLQARSWQQPDQLREIEADTGEPLEGCATLPFEPRVGWKLTDPRADTPTGAEIDLSVPGGEDPDARASAALGEATLALPAGMSLSPAAAPLLEACGDREFGLGVDAPAACPPRSRVGTLEVSSPFLRDPATGVLYLGTEEPGRRFRVLADARFAGMSLKLIGLVHTDSDSGRLLLSLREIPQIPFSHMTLRLDAGAGALLVTPVGCGPVRATATLYSYSGDTSETSPGTAIGAVGGGSCQGPPPVRADFSGGARTPRAGRTTTVSMTLRRRDGEQMLERFSATLPPGMAARLGTIEACEGAQAAAASCPDGSRIGSTTAEIGSGPRPAVLHGDIYLTGPYKRAPYGLTMVYGTNFGPFHLTRYLIRASIDLDPHSGRVTIATDSLPSTVDGMSVRFQTIGLDIDRPGLIVNPTSCRQSSFEATMHATDGSDAAASVPFAVRGCESLGFRPRLSLGILGRRPGRGDPVGLRLGLRSPAAGANLRRVEIQLPRALGFDLRSLPEVCARGDALEDECPAGARLGAAVAHTSLLPGPLRGSVYATQPPGKGLPDLWILLRSKGVQLAVRTRTFRKKGSVFAELVAVPDLPISRMSMRFPAHDPGVFRLRGALCQGAKRQPEMSVVRMEGQDRAYRIERVRIGHLSCGRVAS